MTDKEMTELAAVALGLETEWMVDNQGLPFLHNYENGCEFDPLHNDGDAFRLALELRLDIGYGYNLSNKEVVMVKHVDKFGGCFEEQLGSDKRISVRRTIVRAAAEIGKKMKK